MNFRRPRMLFLNLPRQVRMPLEMLSENSEFFDVVDDFVFEDYDEDSTSDDETECDLYSHSRSYNRLTKYQFRSFLQPRDDNNSQTHSIRRVSAPDLLHNSFVSKHGSSFGDFSDVIDEMVDDSNYGGDYSVNSYGTIPLSRTEQNKLNRMVDAIRNRNWTVDVFDLNLLVPDHVLEIMATIIFQSYAELHSFLPEQKKFKAFLTRVTEHYHPAPYHNIEHAADVLHSVHCLSKDANLPPWQLYALFLAAILIDVGHVGISNRCLKESNHEIYQKHSKSRSPLEAMHAELGLQLLDQSGILESLPSEQLRTSVKTMIKELILGTDLAHPPQKEQVALYILCAADLGKPAKSYSIHSLWTERLTEEFIREGDSQAIEYQLPTSSNGSKRKLRIPYIRSYFLQNRILPLYRTLNERFGIDIKEQLENLDQHIAHWQDQL